VAKWHKKWGAVTKQGQNVASTKKSENNREKTATLRVIYIE